MDDELLTAKEAAKFIMLKEKTLRNWRHLNRKGIEIGPRWGKLGGKVIYRKSDLLAYREEHTYTCTNQYGRKKPPKERTAEPDDAAP